LKIAKDNFKLLLGMSLDEDIAILFDNNIPTVDVNINDAVKYALDQRMEIRQKQITLEQDVFSIIRTKAESEFKGDLSVRVGMDALAGKDFIGTFRIFNAFLFDFDLTDQRRQVTANLADIDDNLFLKIQTLWDFETHKSYLPVDLLK